MRPEEIQKLLGGYATGTLTSEEQQTLFEAALHDQELFDALAREQSLRDLLRDPAARAHLLAAIGEKPRVWWRRPKVWVLAAAGAAACLELSVLVHFGRPKPVARPALVAEIQPAPPAIPAPAAGHSDGPAAQTATAAPPVPKAVKRRPAIRPFLPPESQPKAEGAKDSPAAMPSPPPPVPAMAAPPVPAAPPTGTVQVTAQAPPLETDASLQNARALFYAQPAAWQTQFAPSASGASQGQIAGLAGASSKVMVPNLGVKWTALRKQENGLFSEVDPDQIKAGDVIKLRLVPNDNGYLSVMEGGKPLVAEQRAARLQPFETPEITSTAGLKELVVLLSRNTLTIPAGQSSFRAQPRAADRIHAAGDQLSQADRNEHAVYEVKTGHNLLAPVLVRITLNFQ